MRLALPNPLALAIVGLLVLLGGTASGAEAKVQAGESAYVLGTGGSGVKVRSGPGPSYDVRGVIPEGARVAVANGPQSDGDLAWFLIRATDGAGDPIRGWVAATYLVSADDVSVREDGSFGVRGFEAKVTGYASGHGGAGAYTSTGTRVRWGTVAVDPRFIPLGSLMLIDGLDGVFKAEDTGGGVRGAMVDVWFPDLQAAERWNTRYKKVTILREGY